MNSKQLDIAESLMLSIEFILEQSMPKYTTFQLLGKVSNKISLGLFTRTIIRSLRTSQNFLVPINSTYFCSIALENYIWKGLEEIK